MTWPPPDARHWQCNVCGCTDSVTELEEDPEADEYAVYPGRHKTTVGCIKALGRRVEYLEDDVRRARFDED